MLLHCHFITVKSSNLYNFTENRGVPISFFNEAARGARRAKTVLLISFQIWCIFLQFYALIRCQKVQCFSSSKWQHTVWNSGIANRRLLIPGVSMETQTFLFCYTSFYTGSTYFSLVIFQHKVSEITRQKKNPCRSVPCVLSHAMMGGSGMFDQSTHQKKKKRRKALWWRNFGVSFPNRLPL